MGIIMIDKDKQINITSRVLNILVPMDGVSSKNNMDGTTSIVKNGMVFIKVKGDKIHLLDRNKSFFSMDADALNDRDNFLKKATNAYWIVSGRKL